MRGRGEGEEPMSVASQPSEDVSDLMLSLYSEPEPEEHVAHVSMPHMSRYGDGLIGGRKRRSAPKKMSEATKRYLAEYRKLNPRPRRKRGRGLIGGASQSVYDEIVDDLLYTSPKMSSAEAEELARGYLLQNKDLYKMGVEPRRQKEQLIRGIRGLEKRLGLPMSITGDLNKHTKKRLGEIYDLLRKSSATLRRPTNRERMEAEDEQDLYNIERVVKQGEPAQYLLR